MSRTYLAHHELESKFIVIIVDIRYWHHDSGAQDSFALVLLFVQHQHEMKKSRGCMHGQCVVEHGLCIEVCEIDNNYLHALLIIVPVQLLPFPNTGSLADVCFGSLLQHQLMHLAFGLSRQLSMV